MEYVDIEHKRYLQDDNGELHFIVDRSIKKRIKKEEDWKYKKWEEYNINRALKGYKPIESYGEFIVNILGATISIEDMVIIEEEKNRRGYLKYLKGKDEFNLMIEDRFGGFYFLNYDRLLKVDLEPQYRTRFTYLCAYMGYDNRLRYGNAIGDAKLMLEKDLEEALRLSKRETINTKKALIKANLITIEEDKTITINKEYAIKGKIGKRDLRRSVRIMEYGVKEMYANANAKEHKRLDIFIRLLPFVNYNHNVLCKNPSESDIKKIEPLNLSEVCDIVGYDKTKSVRLKNELLKIKVDGQLALGIFESDNGKRIYINPRVYYKGKDIESLRALINMFRI